MPRGNPTHHWTEDRDAQLCRLVAEGKTMDQIAARMDISRSSASGRINRLRAAGDGRLPPAGPSPIQRHGRTIAAAGKRRLAEVMAQGCPTLTAAAYRLKMPVDDVTGYWRQIRADLGWQAV